MEIREPKMPTPEEVAKMQKERALSDAELIKGGAEYNYDEKGNSRLEVTEQQKSKIKKEHYEQLSLGDLPDGESFIVFAIETINRIKKELKDSGMDYSKQMAIEDEIYNLEHWIESVSDELKESKTRGYVDLKRIANDEFKNKK